ncbi:molecular chaperone DnaJ [Halochromatium salexigens]|uniref:Molecular chaperone DnaJ n=1 Tax=Halochromatium salexigens TaxID=49447 RepID=A0AAJ0UD50_HALSE|nr:molecular chaperone DnaJ [Halochromatium salexigens]MBK5929304.1 molecular chaperone DnaJ [Halochromatium salexigens]
MARLLILLIIVGGLLWVLYWFSRMPATQVARVLRRVALWGGVGLLVIATLSGRLNPIFAALAAAIPVGFRILHLLHMLPMLQRVLRSLGLGGLGGAAGAGGKSGQRSAIRTRYLAMSLDHESGAMDGDVREGPFQGRHLSELVLDQLLRMLELYQDNDEQSAAVLTAYLEREHPDWREQAAEDGADGEARDGREAPGSGGQGTAGAMTRDDALAILGLDTGAEPEQIRAAHRRLMQKLHPDRGGSDYLAAKINAAKTLLLGD